MAYRAKNEPVRQYAPGTPERASLKARLDALAAEQIDIPLVIGGKDIRTGSTADAVMPHDYRHVLATYHQATADDVARAVDAARAAHGEWAERPLEDRAAIF